MKIPIKSFEIISNKQKKLIIAFSGFIYFQEPYTHLAHHFEWKNSLMNRHEYDFMFIRDLNMSWYLKGIYSHSNDVESTLNFLLNICKKYEQVFVIGASMGGFASLLYTFLLSEKYKNIKCLSFAPQTNLSEELWKYNDWMESKVNEFLFPQTDEILKFWKLKNIINKKFDAKVIYSKENRYDTLSVNEISKFIEEVPINTNAHNVALHLKKLEKLDKLINTFLS